MRLRDWVQTLTDEDLPPFPFTLHPGIVIEGPKNGGPSKFLERIKIDAAQGSRGPRARTGAIQADLRSLYKLCNSDHTNKKPKTPS